MVIAAVWLNFLIRRKRIRKNENNTSSEWVKFAKYVRLKQTNKQHTREIETSIRLEKMKRITQKKYMFTPL